MIEVTYYYSACVAIKTKDISILCDPWFTEGIYDGSWFHYPPIKDPMSLVGKHDIIYVSHIHPDHYDQIFLRQYLNKYPKTQIVIADFNNNYLSKKMIADGIPHKVTTTLSFEDTKIHLFPQEIDSALGVKFKGHKVLNMNDSWCHEAQQKEILGLLGNPDIALFSHTGAGAFPQTYFEINNPDLLKQAKNKKQDSFKRYHQLKAAFKPKKIIPFAGQYLLGGKLYYLNPFRGVSDPLEVCAFDEDAVVLDTGGSINTCDMIASKTRDKLFDLEDMQNHALSLSHMPMDYEHAFSGLNYDSVNWNILLNRAYKRAISKLPSSLPQWHCIKMRDNWFCMSLDKDEPEIRWFSNLEKETLEPRIETYVDFRYLYGLLNGYYHWNNAEIGSQYFTRRYPEIYEPNAHYFLYFFHV